MGPLHTSGRLSPTRASSMGTGAPGRKAHGGGKGRKNKDHRLHCLQRTIHKNRWDDICATDLKVENYDNVVAEKTKLDPDLPGLGQYYCVACRRVFVNEKALGEHLGTSKHKRRENKLKKEKIYDAAEANAAAGRGPPDNG